MERQKEKQKKIQTQYEKCVLCHRRLAIPIDMEIDYRTFYIEGAGQLCYECYQKTYK